MSRAATSKASAAASATDDSLEELLGAPKTANANEMAVFAASAVFVSLIPVHLFINIRGLSLGDMINLVILVVLTVVTIPVLTNTYMTSVQTKKGSLEQARKNVRISNAGTAGLSKKERSERAKATQEKESAQVDNEARLYTIGSVNIIFLSAFTILQSVLPFSPLYDYAASIILASLAIHFLVQPRGN